MDVNPRISRLGDGYPKYRKSVKCRLGDDNSIILFHNAERFQFDINYSVARLV